jgi:hypothetical protein
MTIQETIRQGDVLLRKLPDGWEFSQLSWAKPIKVPDNILAYGEGSGHAHVIEGENDDFEVKDGVLDGDNSARTRVVNVKGKNATLVHRNLNTGELTGDHSEIELQTGAYEMIPQQEMDDQKVVRVID